jgi:SAM-dependent methyltransferase
MTKGSGYVRTWNEEADPSKDLSNETRKFLVEYARIEPSTMEKHIIHIVSHILAMIEKMIILYHQQAKKAFEIESYPCFQKFMFLHFDLYHSPSYQLVLKQVKSGDMFLDLGCGLGQDIRRLVYDGAPSENLIGLELRQAFVDLGHELFQDKSDLKSKFLVQNFFVDTPEITSLAKKVKVINSGMFMHLWDWEKQIEVAKRMIYLLTPDKGAMITGLHFGSRSAGMWEAVKESPMFVHNPETLKDLWGQCAQETGTVWDFRCVVEEVDYCQDLDSEACILRWTAERL